MVKHYHKRVKQRANINKETNANAFANNAFRNGFPPAHFKDYPPLHNFLLNKEKNGKRVKVYHKWIFIFNSTNNNPVTMYPVPERFVPYLNESQLTSIIIFKFFYEDVITMSVQHEKIDFKHIKSCFKHLLEQNKDKIWANSGPYCIKEDGTIEKDYKCVGMWHVYHKNVNGKIVE